jgi:high affinity sulfate transporter 1
MNDTTSPLPENPQQIPSPIKADNRTGWKHWLPGLSLLCNYEKAWLRDDLIAGLVLTSMLVPVGIAHAAAAGMPGINGLYATILSMLAYALFGPSRLMVVGPDSSLAAVILAVVLPLSNGDPVRAVALGGMMAIVTGVVLIIVGVVRLCFITELLSKPIRYGYMNGIALSVLISQVPRVFGFSIETRGPLSNIWSIVSSVLNGMTNWTTFYIGIGTMVTIVLLKAYSKQIPGILIAVIGATVIVGHLDLATQAQVAVLGTVPQGLPEFVMPWITVEDISSIFIGGCAAALVSFADTSVLSRIYATKTNTYIDPNQEMVALGFCNLFTGLFQGFPISSSTSRTPVSEAAGAKTQLTGIIGAIAVAIVLVAAPDLMRNLPRSALAAIVITSAMGLIEVTDLRRIYRIQRGEFWLSIVCTASVMVFGAIQGIGLAIMIAVIAFLWSAWRPHYAILGRVKGISGYHDITHTCTPIGYCSRTRHQCRCNFR